MRHAHKTLFAWSTIFGMTFTAAAVVGTSDDFGSNTTAGWVSVGAASTMISYDAVSAEDYDDGNLSQKLAYTPGMLLTGDGLKSDGGLRFNTQNATSGDEAIGLSIGGTMAAGEVLAFFGGIYNDNSSFSDCNAQLWNLTDGTLLVESGNIRVLGNSSGNYVPAAFSVAYTAGATDEGDVLQIRFRESNNSTSRDIYIDNYTLTTGQAPPPTHLHPRLFFSTNELADLTARRLTTHADEWAQVLSTCANLSGTLPTTTPRTASGLLGYEDKIVALALAQLVDPSQPYQATSEAWFWTIMDWTEWGPGYWSWPDYGPRGNLETGEILRALAIWYDLQYHNLSPAERVDASTRLADYADRYRNSYSRFWTTDNGELTGNHCWNSFAALAAVLYASDEVSPARQADWISLLDGQYTTISNLMNTVMSDGSTGEGLTYWTYGIEKILLWFEMRNVAGVSAFDGIDWFANTGTYGIFGILPGGTDNFGGITRYDDADKDYWGNPYNELTLLAKVTQDPVAQWMATELDHNGESKKNSYRYMFYDASLAAANPETDLNNWHFFDDYGLFFWRNSWANNAQHFTLRSGQHSHGHSKGDDGQFMLSRSGVPYIVNLGYSKPRYSRDSNVLQIDGTGQYSDGDDWGTIFNATWPANSSTWGQTLHVLANDTYYQKGDFFNVLIDPTQMYTSPKLSSWQREVVGLGGDLYLIRDDVLASSSVDFDLLLHAVVTSASGDSYDENSSASSNPWTDLGSGTWELDARSGAPKLMVQDLSDAAWSAAIEQTWYWDKNEVWTRRGNRLKRSRTGTAGTSLISLGFDDLMSGWTQSAWTHAAAEGIHVMDAGSPVADVLWPLNGVSASASDGWSVIGKMAGRRRAPAVGNAYLGWIGEYDGTSSNTLALYKFDGVYTNGANAYSSVLPDQPGSDWDAFYPHATATCIFSAGGKFGEGLAVPGGGSSAARCSTYNGATIFPAGADPSLSMECWVMFNDTTSRQFLISKGNGWSSTGGYDLWYDNGVLNMAISGGSANVTSGSWTPVAGTWVHIAGTWNAATDTATLYVDGAEIASEAFPGLSIVDHAGRALAVGNRSTSTYYALDGMIDEVRISDVAYAFSRHFADTRVCYFGREVTSIIDGGQTLLSATTPISFHAKTEYLPGGTVPNRIVVSANAASTATFYCPHEPASVLIDNGVVAHVWSNGQLTVTIPAAERSLIDLVSGDYRVWRDNRFSEAEVNVGLSGLDIDADGDGRSNWEEFVADTDPRDGNAYWGMEIDNGAFSFGSSTARVYGVDYSTNLVDGTWLPLIGPVPGTGAPISVVDTNDYRHIFYRVNVTVPQM